MFFWKMSQSDAHRDLVLAVVAKIASRHPNMSIVSDVQQNPGDAVPPMISGFRPDVYATISAGTSSVIIAEAKTDSDLDNQHTDNQLSAFTSYLESKKNGCFILSVTGHSADYAKTLLRFLRQTNNITNTDLIVFDSLDLWKLDKSSGVLWHLI